MKALLLAPARWIDDETVDRFRAVLAAADIDCEVDPQVRLRDHQLAGDDVARGAALNAALGREDVDILWCARGGYGSGRLLPLLDQPRRRQVLVGYSDMTSLLLATHRSPLIGVHGGMAIDVNTPAKSGNLPAAARLCRVLLRRDAAPGRDPIGMTTVRPGTAEGPLLAANLSVLNTAIGTPFLPDLSGHILCLEDIGEYMYALDRMFLHLALSGIFDRIAGLVLGSFSDLQDNDVPWGADVAAMARHYYGGPIAAKDAFGHAALNLPVAIGAAGRLVAGEVSASLDIDLAPLLT